VGFEEFVLGCRPCSSIVFHGDGLFSSGMLRSYDPMGWEYPSWAHINGPAVNLLKGGIMTADRVMTVSKVRCAAICSLTSQVMMLSRKGGIGGHLNGYLCCCCCSVASRGTYRVPGRVWDHRCWAGHACGS